MYKKGQEIRHIATGITGTITEVTQTYFPTIDETRYSLLVHDGDGREWITRGRFVEAVQ